MLLVYIDVGVTTVADATDSARGQSSGADVVFGGEVMFFSGSIDKINAPTRFMTAPIESI